MPLTLVVGGFFGDEGKGVVNAYLTLHDKMDAAVRGQGPQAGHTVFYNGNKDVFRQIPSSVYRLETQLFLNVGAFVRPDVVKEEVERYSAYNVGERLKIDENATAILPEHVDREAALKESIGSVGTGVAPALVDRVMRREDVLVKYVDELKKYSKGVHTSDAVNNYLDEGKSVIIEGAHATGLSNFHGTYPYTNAYDNIAAALLSQTGVGPKRADSIVLVFKSFVSRVGKGPLNGELSAEECEKLGWCEYGTVSGRRRRAAPFDIKFAKNNIRLNSPTDIALTKVDILYPETARVRDYSRLSVESRKWIEGLESQLRVPISLIKTGPELYDIIDLRKEKGTLV